MNDTYSISNVDMKLEALTFEKLLETYYGFLNANPTVIEEMKCAPNVFKRLNRYFEEEQEERERQGVKSMPKEDIWLTSLYGMKVVVDPEMEPGTWKFVGKEYSRENT